MPMEWSDKKVATLLMWSGTEVAKAILGNCIVREIGVNGEGNVSNIMDALSDACAIQDSHENSTYYLRCMCSKGWWCVFEGVE